MTGNALRPFFLLPLALLGCAHTHRQVPGEQAIVPLRNPGFSVGGGVTGNMPGVALHWQTTDGKAYSGWYNLDALIYRSPPASQRITYVPGISDPWGTVWQFTPPNSIEPGREYEASVYCRVAGFEGASLLWGGLRLAIRFMADEQTVLSEHRAPLDENEDHDWKKVSVRAIAPEGATRLQFLVYLHSESGTVWYDDAQVIDLGVPERE